MRRRLGKWGLSLFFVLAGCATPVPIPPGALAFGVLGDAPYTEAEIGRLDAVIDRINAEPLAFVVHVGDIGSSTPEQACGDRWLEARKQQLARIRHPFLLIPGDNEWSDCKQPLERLKAWRQVSAAVKPSQSSRGKAANTASTCAGRRTAGFSSRSTCPVRTTTSGIPRASRECARSLPGSTKPRSSPRTRKAWSS
jgi:hypothetical protein